LGHYATIWKLKGLISNEVNFSIHLILPTPTTALGSLSLYQKLVPRNFLRVKEWPAIFVKFYIIKAHKILISGFQAVPCIHGTAYKLNRNSAELKMLLRGTRKIRNTTNWKWQF
jgi:hypothetical protein